MSLKCGIVGLPNVGKSTFFNTISKSNIAEAANYPFCTIEPNKAFVNVYDERLYKIANICKAKKITPTQIEIIDIAGLVKGASKGEGCGNKFLNHISEVDLILHVVRCFEDDNVAHIEGIVNPISDIKTIETELLLHDLEKLEKKLHNIERKAKAANAKLIDEINLIKDLIGHVSKDELVINYKHFADFKDQIKSLFLLTSKPVIYMCNVKHENISNTNKHVKQVMSHANNGSIITACAQIQGNIQEQKNDWAKDSINKLTKAIYDTLGFQSYFTAGEVEARMWPIKKGVNAKQAAGVIHSDFEDGFIKAEVIKYENYIQFGEKAKEKGLMKLAGKCYIVQDGDVMHFLFNKTK